MIGKELWFEGMYQQIFRGGYRFWQGVVLLGFAGPLLSQLGVWWLGDILVKGTEYVVQVNPQTRISIAVTSALLSAMSQIGGRFTRERIQRLFHKTSQMKDGIMWNFGTVAETRMIVRGGIALAVVFSGLAILGLYTLSGVSWGTIYAQRGAEYAVPLFLSLALLDVFFQLPLIFTIFSMVTFLWVVLSTSRYLAEMSRSKLRLDHFGGADYTLGLKKFVPDCIYLVLEWELLPLAIVVSLVIVKPDVLTDFLGSLLSSFASSFGGLTAGIELGVGFFVLIVWGFHKQLRSYKKEKLDWIASRYREIVHRVESKYESFSGLGRDLSTELLAVDNIRRDVSRIHDWPFASEALPQVGLAIFIQLIVALLATILAHNLR